MGTSYNNVNQLTSQSVGGSLRFHGAGQQAGHQPDRGRHRGAGGVQSGPDQSDLHRLCQPAPTTTLGMQPTYYGIRYYMGGQTNAKNDPWDKTGRPDIAAGAQFADQYPGFLASPIGPKNPCGCK